jgi:hypothetical protein
MTASAFRRHAQDVLQRELRRRRDPLAGLPAERRPAVEESIAKAVAASVEGVLDHARDDPLVAAALESVYGTRSVLTPAPARPD